jgi:predicted ATP-binding protein involved in virulence
MPEALLRVAAIEVRGLFGLYDHTIRLNSGERVTILHGPNGVGKTVVLRMLHALLTGKLTIFTKTPFSAFRVEFEGGGRLGIEVRATEAQAARRGHACSSGGGDDVFTHGRSRGQ